MTKINDGQELVLSVLLPPGREGSVEGKYSKRAEAVIDNNSSFLMGGGKGHHASGTADLTNRNRT